MNTNNNEQLEFSIVNTNMTVQAIRDSGYKSTMHALAELIDNSIEAGATSIELCGLSGRSKKSGTVILGELAVLDNGEGMDKNTLRGSLRYGHGTRTKRRGIGRFGVGLPNSSMSQARRVDVWSWQTGPTNALHTYLSIDEVRRGIREIPEPTLKPIPSWIRESTHNQFGDTGTLVLWSDLDRVEWKKAATTFRHLEEFLGRVYRRFLARPSERLHPDDDRGHEIGPQRSILCISVERSGGPYGATTEDVVEVKPNDPLYLMSDTSCPEYFGPGPMFAEIESSPFTVDVPYEGVIHKVRVRAACARAHVRDPNNRDAAWPEAYKNQDSGSTPWGKHANRNRGVSVMRAHREIEVDDAWLSGDDPRERWWTIEVDFPTALDEIFGVTNNKQGTVTFQRIAKFDWKSELLGDETTKWDVSRRMRLDGDYRVHLLELRNQIERAIKQMREQVRKSAQKRPSRHARTENQKADSKATVAINERNIEGKKGESDIAAETGTKEEHKKVQEESLVKVHDFPPKDATSMVMETIESNSRVRWIQSPQDSPAFFNVEPLPGVIQVALNTNHPVCKNLYDLLQLDGNEPNEMEMTERIAKAAAAFRLLIYAWARFEEEQTNSERRRVRNTRHEWGKIAEDFYEPNDE